MAIFKGAAVAIVTPMHEDGKVNYEKLEELLEYQIANSTDAIVICGTTGESSTLTHGEHLQTIKFAIDKVAGRVPVIAGTGSNCTETAVMMSQEAASYGADALDRNSILQQGKPEGSYPSLYRDCQFCTGNSDHHV